MSRLYQFHLLDCRTQEVNIFFANTASFSTGPFSVLIYTNLRIQHKLGVTVHRYLQGKAPQYLIDCSTQTSEVASRQRFRSASRRAFSVAGPMV